jgi:hypothetical protein
MSDTNITRKEECREEYLKTSFDHSQRLIELADNKASIVLGIIIFMIPINFGVGIFSGSNEVSTGLMIILYSFFILTTIIFGMSFYYATQVIKGRLTNVEPNLIFFGEIIKKKPEDYKKTVLDMSPSAILDDYMKEIYALAQINTLKYQMFGKSLNYLKLGFILLVIGYVIAGFFSIYNLGLI